MGRIGYYLLPRKKTVVYANLKTVFSASKSPHQLERLSLLTFINLAQSFVEFLCLPKMKQLGFKNLIRLKGKENIESSISQGKGTILLAIHSGNWEFGSVGNSMIGHPYHLVAKEQPKIPQLDFLLNQLRKMAGARVIPPGVATKEIIRALKRNEIVSMVLDQGGKDGVAVDFFGKSATMSSGAVRLALKYGCSICPAWITRQSDGSHLLEYFSAMHLTSTGHLENDIRDNVQQAARHYEDLLKEVPGEYLWFYNVFKYTKDAQTLILDDGDTEHLRQSQAVVKTLVDDLNKQGKKVKECVFPLDFRTSFRARSFPLYSFFSRFLSPLRREHRLKYFLTDSCYLALMRLKADFVVSCGKRSQGINYILSANHLAKSFILTSGF